MRKRIISVTLAALLSAMPFHAMAKTAVFGNITADGTIEISLSSDVDASIYGVHILKPGQTIGSVNQVTSGTSTAFAGFETMSLPESSGKKFQSTDATFKLTSGAEEGVYTLIIGGGELAGQEIKVVYDDGYPQAASEAKTAQDLESVLNQYQNKAWSLDLSNSSYLSNKAKVLENMKTILASSAATAESVTLAFQQACALTELAVCDTADIADNLLVYETLFGLQYANDVAESPDGIAAAFANLRVDESMKTPAELNRLVRAAKAVMLLNEASRDQVMDVLTDYNDIFGLDFTGDYTQADPYEVAKKMVAGDTPYTKLAEIQSKFVTSVAEITGTGTGTGVVLPGGGTVGGGAAGGVGGGTTVSAPPAAGGTVVDSDKIAEMDSQEQFHDLDSAQWAIPYIKYLSENEIMQGDGQGNFRPNDGILREEFLKLILAAFDVELITGKAAAFADVDNNAWYKDYVVTGVEYGLIQGISADQFGVGQYISREDAAVMLQRAAESCNISLTETAEEISFTDSGEISDYAAEAVSLLSRAQIINGYETGEFAPKKSILRCEAAKIIYATIKAMAR